MLAWLRRRTAAKSAHEALAETDAAALISRFGDQASYVARDRDREERTGFVVNVDRPPRHWSAVRVRIAAVTAQQVGLDASTRYLKDM